MGRFFGWTCDDCGATNPDFNSYCAQCGDGSGKSHLARRGDEERADHDRDLAKETA